MHIVNSCTNDILLTENSVKSANYHLNRSLSASAWSSLSFLIISSETLPTNLTLNVLLFSSSWLAVPSTLYKILIPTCTFPFQNFSSHYVTSIRCTLLHL